MEALTRPSMRTLRAGALLALLLPVAALAQDGGPDVWSGQAELGGSVFFGNNPQTLVSTRGMLARGDSLMALRADVRFTYGEAEVDGDDEVTRRGWVSTLSLDLMPHGANSPFLLGGYETSLERRIQSRVNWGVGHKVTFHRTPAALLDVSLAILTERSAEVDAEDAVRLRQLGRWSTRLRGKRDVNDRFSLSHETFYRPETGAPRQFTVTSTSSANLKLTKRTLLSLTLLDNYDSTAEERGARTNNDGSLVAGLKADF
jgi:hypothetical protein